MSVESTPLCLGVYSYHYLRLGWGTSCQAKARFQRPVNRRIPVSVTRSSYLVYVTNLVVNIITYTYPELKIIHYWKL